MQERPPAYLCSDPGSFARNTLLVRLPRIAQRMVEENHFPADAVERVNLLLGEMRSGWLRSIEDEGASDHLLWEGWLEGVVPSRWEELPFLVCETVFYRRLLSASGYFQPGPTQGLDPFQLQKDLGLAESLPAIHHLSQTLGHWKTLPREDGLAQAVRMALWGNRADLSLWPAGEERAGVGETLHQPDEFLAVDCLSALTSFLAQVHGGRIDFVIDNAGFELVCDLALADLLVSTGVAGQVHLHLKSHPTFVSDVMIKDVHATSSGLRAQTDLSVREFGDQITRLIEEGRIVLETHPFWTSPLPGWEMPADLRAQLGGADLVVSKGDANLRRLLGDLRWPNLTSFAGITAYFPTRLAALRVCKSEIAAGLSAETLQRLDKTEADWRTNGRWGMILINEKRPG